MPTPPTNRTSWQALAVCALASWPLIALAACSVYEDSLLENVSAPVGGFASDPGAGASSGGVGGAGATTSTGGKPMGNAGTEVGGKSGETSSAGGSAGAGAGAGTGSVGAAGNAMAGTGGDPGSTPNESIDDMEDGDSEILLTGPRNGYWYVGGDLTVGATLTPPPSKFAMSALGAGERSEYAAHVKAVGYDDWGSVMGFNFIELLTKVNPYDASAYCGVEFWGKAAAATTVRFRVPDIDTHQSGGVCKDPGTTGVNGTACYDHFGKSLSFTAAWQPFSVKFADLVQTGSGYHPPDDKLKADKLMAVEWALPGTGKTYEIWIDDVQFSTCP